MVPVHINGFVENCISPERNGHGNSNTSDRFWKSCDMYQNINPCLTEFIIKIYLHLFYHISCRDGEASLNSSPCLWKTRGLFIVHVKNHGCWGPGTDINSQRCAGSNLWIPTKIKFTNSNIYWLTKREVLSTIQANQTHAYKGNEVIHTLKAWRNQGILTRLVCPEYMLGPCIQKRINTLQSCDSGWG